MRAELDREWESNRDPHSFWEIAENMPIRRALAGESSELYDCWRASGITAANRELFDWSPDSNDRGLRGFGLIQAQFDRLPWLSKALAAEDIRRAKQDGSHTGLVTIQNTSWLDGDLSLLRAAHDFGMRMAQITYNTMNIFGCGCTERVDAGLSAAGVRLVQAMKAIGMIVDVSHCGPRTTLDACRVSEVPIVASHTSARAVYTHARGKDDDVLEAIAATGGVIGIYAVPYFLSAAERPSIEAMLDHLDHVLHVVGPEHVGIGTDRPFQLPLDVVQNQAAAVGQARGFRPQDRINSVYPNLVGFDDYRDFPNITRGLVARGYSDETIVAILGGNFVRVFEQICG
jgi:membrane dipeptidase